MYYKTQGSYTPVQRLLKSLGSHLDLLHFKICKQKKEPSQWIFQPEDNHLFWVGMNSAWGYPTWMAWESPPHPYVIQWILVQCMWWSGLSVSHDVCYHGYTDDRGCPLWSLFMDGTLNFDESVYWELYSTLSCANQWIGYFVWCSGV